MAMDGSMCWESMAMILGNDMIKKSKVKDLTYIASQTWSTAG
jgi:hypothetical protein